MSTQTSLAKAFNARSAFFAHRSSAIFPVRLTPTSDLHVVFLNYWFVKNGTRSIGVNLRLYDTDGLLVVRTSLERIELHNDTSIRAGLIEPNSITMPFEGMVEVEIVSCENLRFPFPAILGVYESNGCFSSVHSAGRVLNSDELKKPSTSEESNWTCKFVRDADGRYVVIPFFHYFVGAEPIGAVERIEVNLRKSDGTVLATTHIDVGHLQPFASRIYFADEIFDLADLPPEGAFLSVRLVAFDVFPRLVVGNLHREKDFLEVTHSFPLIEVPDFCPVPDPVMSQDTYGSLLTAQTVPGLALNVRVFPTNCAGSVEASVSRKRFSDERLISTEQRFALESHPGSPGMELTLGDDEEMRVLHLRGEEIPSRLNASYRYSVAGAGGRFSTDIATGAKSSVYPPKGRHWGHGCVGGGFNSVVMFHNNTHDPRTTVENIGEIRVLGDGIDSVFPVVAGAESSVALDMASLLGISTEEGTPKFFSWFLSMKVPVGETFWVSYRPDGAIFGEHGF
jgi:hypothetical protein